MATEAQKLIAVSLGKIATSRGQRGGVKLFKNLLVSSVLQKARTAYMMENFQQAVVARKAREEQKNIPEVSEKDTTPEPKPEVTLHELQTAGKESSVAVMNENKENAIPSENISNDMDSKHENSENPETKSDENDSSIDKNCHKCNKRRLSEIHNHVENSDVSPLKRMKYDSNSNTENRTIQPMETQQITTLVQRFNTGLSGFLSGSNPTPCETIKAEQNSQVQGHSESLSCSTQIKEAFETLARPILALAV